MAQRPFLLVRARVHPGRLEEFRAWYRAVHVPHVLLIPGIVEHRALRWGSNPPRGAPNVMSAFIFEREAVIEKALQSEEAQRARRDWQDWAQHVRDLTIQVYATIDAGTTLHHLN